MYFTKYIQRSRSKKSIFYHCKGLLRGNREKDSDISKPTANKSTDTSQLLKPVTSKEVMNGIQMDIVDMTRNPVEISEDKLYRYVLVVLDVFSRFIFLRPFQSKSSTEVASVVMQIFSDVGPPKIIQTDQGTEFKGVVEQVMNKLKVKIIHSRPYHPQSQGKVLLLISFVMVIHFVYKIIISEPRLRGLIAHGSLS